MSPSSIAENAATFGPFAIFAGIMAVALIVAAWTVARENPTAKAGFLIFAGGLFVFLVLFAASLTPVAAVVLRLILLFAATFLPAMLYFLFIAARRESLFNAFAANLERLGLLRRWWTAGPDPMAARKTLLRLEPSTCRQRRGKSYLDRFGAVYGSLSDKFVADFLASIENEDGDTRPGAARPEGLAIGAIGGGSFDFQTIIPVLGATCLVGLGWIATLPPGVVPTWNGATGSFGPWFEEIVTPTLSPMVFAFLGAYFFSLQMVIKRFVRRDLGANAYNAISLRILLAVVGVWVALKAFDVFDPELESKTPWVLVAAFAIGAFPLIVWQIVTAALKKVPVFQWSLPSLTASQPLDAIDGLSVWHQSRLEEEDVENVPNLATADMVDLLLNTKIPAHRLVDWIDQAILLTYLGQEKAAGDQGAGDRTSLRDRMRWFGIRTATALEAACRDYVGAAPVAAGGRAAEPGVAPVPAAPAAPAAGPFTADDGVRLRSIVAAVYDCPNFTLVRNWRGIADDFVPTASLRTKPSPALAAE